MTREIPLLAITLSLAPSGAAQTPRTWPDLSSAPGIEVRADESGHRALARYGHEAPSADTTAASFLPANWQSLGPFGGDIEDVQASPANASIVLAGLAPSSGGGGLYRSTDAGASWTAVAALNGLSVYAIAFAPDGTAYIGTIDSVWKSADGGASWAQQNLGIGLNDQVLEVEIDPTDATRIWAGIADAIGNQPVNVMLSVDSGATWTNKTPPLASPRSCNGIAVHPGDANRIYACFDAGQVWVSANGGTSWVNRSAGLPGNPMYDVVHDGARILVCGGQLFGSQFVGLYSSANEGVTWTPLHDGTWPTLAIHDIGIDPNDAAVIHVASTGQGLFSSTDGGISWSFGVAGTGSLSVNAVSFSPGSSSVIYLGSSSVAVWKSVDSGTSFAASSTGIGALDVFSIASNPGNAAELAIAFQGLNNGGVYTTLDGGATWSLESVPSTRFSHVYFTAAGQLYAISVGPTTIAPEGLYRRTGASWSGIGPDQGALFESELFTMRVSRTDPDFIVAAGSDFGVAGFQPTVWRTTNAGGMWTKTYEGAVSNKPIQDLAIVDELTDTTMVAAHVDYNGPQNGGVLRSINSGVTWLPSNAGLPAAVQAFSLAKSPTDENTLYISSNVGAGASGLFKSVDAGQSWAATGFLGAVLEVQTDVGDPDVLYIAMSAAPKVRSSSNDGVSFTAYDSGLAGVGFPRDLQRATGQGSDLLLAATTGSYATDQEPGTRYCFGDGLDPVVTAECPCTNFGAAGRGCGNSFSDLGGSLAAAGTTSPNTILFTASSLPNNNLSVGLRTTGNANPDGVVFGDGVRCQSGTLIRFGAHNSGSGGDAANTWTSGAATVAPGLTRYYQVQYRNPAPAFCPPETFNVTNGVRLTW